MGIENPIHLLFIAVVALVVLGPKRLPELTRALGHGIREFREAINGEVSQPHETHVAQSTAAPSPPPAAAPTDSSLATAPAAPADPSPAPMQSTDE